jgi:hypothetical protein
MIERMLDDLPFYPDEQVALQAAVIALYEKGQVVPFRNYSGFGILPEWSLLARNRYGQQVCYEFSDDLREPVPHVGRPGSHAVAGLRR